MTSYNLAIHRCPGSFSERWIEYCTANHIGYRSVDCLNSNLISEISSYDALLWHWQHQTFAEQLVARNVIYAAEEKGSLVFPSFSTCCHYDDKIAQKYLLEAVGAPFVATHIFYDRESALHFVSQSEFPKVFKLRRGAGSANVRLVRSPHEARRLIWQAFGRGFRTIPGYAQDAPKRFSAARQAGSVWASVLRMPQALAKIRELDRIFGRERGYVYFQDFLRDNQYDTRVTVIGDRAFAFTRDVRPSDFRASGSGMISYALARIDPRCLEIAFDVAKRLRAQSIAFDFVADAQQPKIVEISYCYNAKAVHGCSGHWDPRLNWIDGHMWPQDAILIDLLVEIEKRKARHQTVRPRYDQNQ